MSRTGNYTNPVFDKIVKTNQAKEFRIGNLLQDRKGQLCKVISLTEKGFQAQTGTGLTHLPVTPISLTEEWLEKFGFTRGDNISSSDSFYSKQLGVTDLQINPNNGVVWIIHRSEGSAFNTPCFILYVHQLQNLYFGLTGEELTL